MSAVTCPSPPLPRFGSPRRWGVFALGLTSLVTGIALMIAAGLGVGSWQVLETGLVEVTQASFGVVVFAEALVLIALAWVWLGQRPWIATAVLAFAGTGIGALLEVVTTPDDLVAQAAMLAAAVPLVALGVAFYLASELGASAQDSVFVGYYRRYRARPGVVRFIMDGALVLGGWVLGGQVGLGTVVVTIAVPLMIEPALRLGHRLAGTPPPAALAA